MDEESNSNRSTDLYARSTGIDFIIDGHSHTVMTEGANKEPIQSTGTALENVGVIVIDNATKKIEKNELVKLEGRQAEDETVRLLADKIITDVDTRLGEVFAKTEVDLDGNRDPGVRTKGDQPRRPDHRRHPLVRDEGRQARRPDRPCRGLTNGGGIRASIKAGDISMKDINTVLPFGNTVAVIYISGASLLEALEASTYSPADGHRRLPAGVWHPLHRRDRREV